MAAIAGTTAAQVPDCRYSRSPSSPVEPALPLCRQWPPSDGNKYSECLLPQLPAKADGTNSVWQSSFGKSQVISYFHFLIDIVVN
jgi:hypothetical protein